MTWRKMHRNKRKSQDRYTITVFHSRTIDGIKTEFPPTQMILSRQRGFTLNTITVVYEPINSIERL